MSSYRNIISKEIYFDLPENIKLITDNYEGREKDVILLSVLSILSNSFPNYYGLYDDNKVYTNLYVAILAPAASGKGVMNHTRILIEPIHDYVLNRINEYESNSFMVDEEKLSSKKNHIRKEVKILPGDISQSEMMEYFNLSEHGLIIIESEADTIGTTIKNEWATGNSVIFRKAFHNENISMARKTDQILIEKNEPKLSILISGTPSQLLPIINLDVLTKLP